MNEKRPSARIADWSRERFGWFKWTPSGRLVRAIRSYQHWQQYGAWAYPMRRLAGARVRFWNVIGGSDVPGEAQLGGGLMFPHPNGVVVHPNVQIGVNCMIFQQVTLGIGGSLPGAPKIGGHVDIGAGAKILGGVVIGDHARIGANAVVLTDVPAGATAVGVPARIIMPAAESVLEVPRVVATAFEDRGLKELLNAAEKVTELP